MPGSEPWLKADGRPVAPLEVASGRRDRRRGLLGRLGIEGALLLQPADSVHTFWMRFPIDVALCDGELKVLQMMTLKPWRITRPRLRVKAILEAEAGSLEAWGIEPGTQLAVDEAPSS